MVTQYDCIVIGTGCGGSAAAALAAHRGWKTLVLEKNRLPGGRCATHEIRGFKMDHGHLFGRSHKGPHGKLLRKVGCADLIPPFVNVTRTPQMRMIIDKIIRLPQCRNNISTLYYNLREAVKLGFTPGEWLALFRLGFTVALMSRRKSHQLDYQTGAEWFDRYTDNRYLRGLFGSVCAVSFGALPNQASAGELLRVMKAVLWEAYVGYPANGEGAAAVPKSFLRAARRHGAEVRLHCPVDRIVVENNRVTGVETGGKFLAAGRVISNAGLRETALGLVGAEHFAPDYIGYLKNLKYSYGGISLKYALDKPLVDWTQVGKVPADFEANMQAAFAGRVPDDMALMLVCTSNIDPGLAPPGKQIILAITPGPVAEPGTVQWKQWKEKAKRQVAQIVPGIDDHTLFCITSTPDVIARESGRLVGDAVGVAQTIDQVGEKAPLAESPLAGLYYVGADIGSSGIATEMATQSALDLFQKLKPGSNFFAKRRKV